MGGVCHLDMRSFTSIGCHLQHRDPAFPQAQHQHVRLRLSMYNITIYSWTIDTRPKPLSVRVVIKSIFDALNMPIAAGALYPQHPLATIVAAALARRRGHVPRIMDWFGPADKLVLVRLVPLTDAYEPYFDVVLCPLSHSRG